MYARNPQMCESRRFFDERSGKAELSRFAIENGNIV